MNLWQKIHAVMTESESLEKSLVVGEGRNSYKAVGEAEVLNNLKPLLKKHKLICLPVDGEITEVSGTTETEYNGVKKVTARNIAQLKCYFKLIDIETGESVQIVGFGFGADSQDKGSGKAFTYAYKTALSKSFMLFSGEDTDNEHSDSINKPEKKAPESVQPKPKADKPQQTVTAIPPKIAEVPKQEVKPTPFAESRDEYLARAAKEAINKPVEQPKTLKHTCDDCKKEIVAVKTAKGVDYTPEQIIEGTKEKYNATLCWDCAAKHAEQAKK